jgi:hypothetical protein
MKKAAMIRLHKISLAFKSVSISGLIFRKVMLHKEICKGFDKNNCCFAVILSLTGLFFIFGAEPLWKNYY